MSDRACCANPQPQWRHDRVGDRNMDVKFCASCDTVLATEGHTVPLHFPGKGRCVNCGGVLEPETIVDGNDRPPEFQCADCDLYAYEARDLHLKLARVVFKERDLLKASLVAMDQGRLVAAFKLATAYIREVDDALEARAVRLECLESMGYLDRAINEAKQWTKIDPSAIVWRLLADLESRKGHVEGTLQALQRAIRAEPDDSELWMDYAEVLAEVDHRPTALDAASHGFGTEESANRAVSVILALAERYFNEQDYEKAANATTAAGDFVWSCVPLMWLRARAFAALERNDDAQRVLERLLEADPDHADAKEALARMKPRKKRGWLPW